MALRILLLLYVSLTSLLCVSCEYEIPNIKIEILKPQGLRMSIPDERGIGLFAVQGNVNKIIASPDVGEIVGEVLAPTNGRWTYERTDLKFQVGDVINFYIFVSYNGNGFLKDNLSFTVTDNNDIATTEGVVIDIFKPDCELSVTVKGRKQVCSGEVIFFDDFNSLDTMSMWRMEHKIALDHPEYPFISYQQSAVEIRGGNLCIKPSLQQNQKYFNAESIFSGRLDLYNWCTGSHDTCALTAQGSNILPPIVSGRITSKNFAFIYGIVEIRAKLPKGDWLYPELLLVPLLDKYGTAPYASGLIKVASARGNRDFVSPTNETYGNQRLYGGPIMDRNCRESLLASHEQLNVPWGDDYHNYTLEWRPDLIRLHVDGKAWQTYEPSSTLRDLLPQKCRGTSGFSGSKMTPFDSEFVLSLGLAAGGISEFPDGYYNSGMMEKPWRNSASKAKLRFWENMIAWYPTWNEESYLLVDYIKVKAI